MKRIEIDNDRLIALRNENKTDEEISIIFGCGASTIERRRKQLGLTDNVHNIKLNAINDDIIKLYLEGSSIKEIQKKFNLSQSRVQKTIENNGVKIDKSLRHQKYEVNQDYFDEINTEDKAYFLGLLCADGYVSNARRSSFAISLQEEDIDILEKMKKCIGYTGPIAFIESRFVIISKSWSKKQRKLCITNKKLCNRLKELGIIEKKSLVLKFPKWLNKNLHKHFIRGYFDGDGSVFMVEKYKRAGFSMMGTKDFITNCGKIIKENTGCNFSMNQCGEKNTWNLSVDGNNQIEKVLKWLYENATVYMNRKHKKSKEVLEFIKSIPYKQYETKIKDGLRICNQPNCENKYVARGVCQTHYTHFFVDKQERSRKRKERYLKHKELKC